MKKIFNKSNNLSILPREIIEQNIFFIRGYKIMFDKDLAPLYKVKTKELNKAVKRNISRFPSDFMFQVSLKEYNSLRFHFGTSIKGGRRYLPYAFTKYNNSRIQKFVPQ